MAKKAPLAFSTGSLASTSTVADIDIIRRGFPWPVAHKLQGELGLTDPRFASFLGMSGRTIARLRKSQKKLDQVASDRLYRLKRVMDLAASVFEDRELGLEWLKSPQFGFNYKIPMDLLDTEPGFEAVETLLLQIEYGVIS